MFLATKKIKIFPFCFDLQPFISLIDSDEEKSSVEVANERVKTKPCPKSKKPSEAIEKISDLPACSIVIEKIDESQEMQRITRSSKRRAETLNSSDGSESTEKETVEDNSSNEPKRQKTSAEIPKNFDKSITIKSKKCVICSKNMKYSTNHYVTCHEGYEIYCARISASESDKLRRHPPKPAEYENSKISAFCYYCEKGLKIERSKWIDHFIRHTGEYTRHCKQCDSIVTADTKKTSVCAHSDIKYVPMVDYNDKLFVYMCNFCNYTQSLEENMKNHIRNTHEIKVNVSVDRYTRIDFIPNFRRTRNSQGDAESTTTNNSDNLENQDVFKSSEQDEEVLKPSFITMRENAFNNSAQPPVRTTSISTSIADLLSKRFKNQEQNVPPIKEESVDTSVIYRSAAETENDDKKDAIKLDEHIVQSDADDQEEWEDWGDATDLDDEDEDASSSKVSNNFNRLIMHKGKQPKRSRGKKRDKRLSLIHGLKFKKENADETIDLSVEKPEIRAIAKDIKRVDNIAVQMFLGTQKFQCNIGNCDFISIDNPSSLSNHLRKQHTEPWTGYCHSCDKQIHNGNFSLMKELNHLTTFHVPMSTPMKQTTKVSKPETEPQKPEPVTPEQLKPPAKESYLPSEINLIPPERMIFQELVSCGQCSYKTKVRANLIRHFQGGCIGPVNVVTPEPPKVEQPVIKVADPPRIKVRRFSGDKLSASSTQNVLIQPQLHEQSSSLFDLNIPTDPNNAADYNDNPLKPWTKCINTKSKQAELKLKRDCSLVALFKCMAIDCIFTTSDKDSMLRHLNNHEDLLMTEGSFNQDDSTWLECCYCEEIIDTCTLLVKHINEVHSKSIFQCPYCFYRSVDQNNVSSHLNQYHANEEEKYIFVCGSETSCLSDEINQILYSMTTNVREIPCTVPGKLIRQISILSATIDFFIYFCKFQIAIYRIFMFVNIMIT